MTRLKTFIGLVAIAMLATACHPQSTADSAHTQDGLIDAPSHDVVVLAAKAEGGVQATATIAALGSFEWDAAPLTNKAADMLLGIPLALKKHEMTRAEAQSRVDQADRAHAIIQRALSACRQDPKTGKCRGSESKARALLDQAKAQLAGL